MLWLQKVSKEASRSANLGGIGRFAPNIHKYFIFFTDFCAWFGETWEIHSNSWDLCHILIEHLWKFVGLLFCNGLLPSFSILCHCQRDSLEGLKIFSWNWLCMASALHKHLWNWWWMFYYSICYSILWLNIRFMIEHQCQQSCTIRKKESSNRKYASYCRCSGTTYQSICSPSKNLEQQPRFMLHNIFAN